MQNVSGFGNKLFDKRSVLALVMLAPALFWWSALVVSLAALTGITAYLGSNLGQLLILVVCPLSAVLISMSLPNGSRLRWTIAIVGTLLTTAAFLAAYRPI